MATNKRESDGRNGWMTGALLAKAAKLALDQAESTFPRSLRFQASGDAEIKTVPRHFARANQADRCITLLHCAQRLTP